LQPSISALRISETTPAASPDFDESLEAASIRAREVARLVSEASAEGTRGISEQYERVRENAEQERQRSRGDAGTEQTAGDTQTLFHNANERFAEAVQGMKQMARRCGELEATRSELCRGLRTTAGNGRKHRADASGHRDQIEALAELNRRSSPAMGEIRCGRAGTARARGAGARRGRRPQ
jgi:hypothetical protein